MIKGKKRKLSRLVGSILVLLFFFAYYVSTNTNNNFAPQQVVPRILNEEFAQLEGKLCVSFIDVGQADSILIEQGDACMLIDCGTEAAAPAIIDYLRSRNIDKLDYLALTHPHEDHIGGAARVLQTFPVAQVYMPDKPHDIAAYRQTLEAIEQQGTTLITAEAGSSFSLGEAELQILAPLQSYEDLNNCSIVLRLVYQDTSFLFAGDAEAASEADMLMSGDELSADLIKLGHHGSNKSSYRDFLEAVSPQIAIISCGKDNDYGHPSSETLQNLQELSINTFRTDEEGSIMAISDGTKIKIYTQR